MLMQKPFILSSLTATIVTTYNFLNILTQFLHLLEITFHSSHRSMKFSVLTVSAFMVTKIAMAKKSSDSLPASSESTSLLDGPRNFLRSGRSLSYEEEVDGKSGEYEINWEEMKDLPQARSDFTATLVNGKDVWMLGGCGADQTRAPWDK